MFVIVWNLQRCRKSPPCFLVLCLRGIIWSRLVLFYGILHSLLFWLIICLCMFLYCFVCQYQSSDWLFRLPLKWHRLCRGIKLYFNSNSCSGCRDCHQLGMLQYELTLEVDGLTAVLQCCDIWPLFTTVLSIIFCCLPKLAVIIEYFL